MPELHSTPPVEGKTLTPEILVPRLGEALVEKGLIAPADLQTALQRQRASLQSGQTPPLLGRILVEMSLLSEGSLNEVITEQIIQLRTALQDANRQLERRVLERTAELETALKRLGEFNELKANFIANISHELRTPLTHLKGYLELLVGGDLGATNSEQAQALQIIQRSSERLERLIEDLILFSSSEKGAVQLILQPVNLRNLCLSCINSTISKANHAQVTLKLECDSNLPLVQMDDEKITWAILQLLDNATKFTPPGGEVILKVSHENQLVRISVSDTGIGIAPDKLEEIFLPFQQLDSSAKRRFGGTGLGLALVRKILEAHGAILKVSSQLSRGSCFEILLNADQASQN